MPLVRAGWISFRRGKGLLFSVLLLVFLWLLFSVSLRMEGTMTIDGEQISLSDEMRADFALRIGLRSTAFFGMLFVLFHGAKLLVGDVERGDAHLELTAPISRTRYLLGRGAGLVTILAAFWIASLLLFAFLLGWQLETSHGTLLAGAALLLLGQLLLGGLVLFLRLVVSGGWGSMVGLLVWVASWFLGLDLVEAYLFDVEPPGEGGRAWWFPLLEPYLAGAPAGPKAAVVRLLCRLFPPIGNVQSVGLDLALGRDIFPTIDWWAVPSALVWSAILWGGSFALFRRKDF